MNSHLQRNTSTWYALSEFETRDITSRSYQERHSLELSASKARGISSNFIQAREYFRSASAANLTVRPLLQYYGVASLSRGLTLFLEPKKSEASLKQSHGLQICDWEKDLSNGLNSIGNLRIRVTKGLFNDRIIATKNKFYFRANSSVVNWQTGGDIPSVGSEFVIDELAARIPEVSNQYTAWTGKHVPFLVLQSLKVDHTKDLIEYNVAAKDEEKLDSVFPIDIFPSRSITKDGSNLQIECNRTVVSFFAQKLGMLDIGDVVLYRPPQSRLYFTPMVTCFILSYALGMLCRYFPTTWISIGRAEKGDAFYPIATRLMDWIQDTFPAMVVDVLKGPYDFEAN